ncbi:MAG: DUF4202 domain-containing protein [Planctomycetota bacterium]|nr:MAG: DUF4202 domain-containing protein [Planctomycetota bacterium]
MSTSDTPWAAIRAAIDAAHAADPQLEDGVPAELRYADRVEAWVCALLPDAGPFERLPARCQHLERWAIPRDDYPRDRPSYLRWRRDLGARQGQRARELALAQGLDEAQAERLERLAAKRAPKDDALAQAMEDAACLVFLEHHAVDFAGTQPSDKVVDILRKTWGKISPAGQEAALRLDLHPAVKELVGKALGA